MLFVASMPDGVLGGRRWRRQPVAETLCVKLPSAFYWLNSRGRFRRARVWLGTDNMQSQMLTAYAAEKRQNLMVHRVLGWTFRCPWEIRQWDNNYDVHHSDDNHHNNRITNLHIWTASGPQGHRAHSGRRGAMMALQENGESVQ